MDQSGPIRDDERLRRLEAVTDATLSRLEATDMLDELLERVRDLVDADVATIMLIDAHARQLVAVAAKGRDDEIRRGTRIPIGEGFAGRIADTHAPVILSDVTPADLINPILIQEGIRSLAGVPMIAGGEIIGVLQVGTLEPRQFTDDDIGLLELAADRATAAGRIRSHELEQAAALTLQRSLLPTRLPTLPGLTMAARYVPGHEFGIGGDWYDVFTLPTGWLGVVIGDVAGHGLASAVVMGRIRSALRAYSLITDDPAQALTMLDRKVYHFEAGSLTTAVYAMISPDRETIRVSSAGHLLPIIAAPGRPATLVDMPVDAPLGIGRHRGVRRTTVAGLPPGAVLLLYTDGLVERRDHIIDTGIAALIDVVRPDDPDTVCATVMSRIGLDQPTDDIAVLVVRRDPAREDASP